MPMPIYEYYCESCNVLFKFFSRSVDTSTRPDCPRCGKIELSRQMSTFATLGHASEESSEIMAGMDESRMEEAFGSLMQEAEGMGKDDPRQMASLMRSFTTKTGMKLGDTMEEAISRMEKGEDPECVERELGDRLEGDDLFSFESIKRGAVSAREVSPEHDEKLYDLKGDIDFSS